MRQWSGVEPSDFEVESFKNMLTPEMMETMSQMDMSNFESLPKRTTKPPANSQPSAKANAQPAQSQASKLAMNLPNMSKED